MHPIQHMVRHAGRAAYHKWLFAIPCALLLALAGLPGLVSAKTAEVTPPTNPACHWLRTYKSVNTDSKQGYEVEADVYAAYRMDNGQYCGEIYGLEGVRGTDTDALFESGGNFLAYLRVDGQNNQDGYFPVNSTNLYEIKKGDPLDTFQSDNMTGGSPTCFYINASFTPINSLGTPAPIIAGVTGTQQHPCVEAVQLGYDYGGFPTCFSISASFTPIRPGVKKRAC